MTLSAYSLLTFVASVVYLNSLAQDEAQGSPYFSIG
jgi:hypothetical protein